MSEEKPRSQENRAPEEPEIIDAEVVDVEDETVENAEPQYEAKEQERGFQHDIADHYLSLFAEGIDEETKKELTDAIAKDVLAIYAKKKSENLDRDALKGEFRKLVDKIREAATEAKTKQEQETPVEDPEHDGSTPENAKQGATPEEDAPSTDDLEANKGKMGWFNRAQFALGMKVVQANDWLLRRRQRGIEKAQQRDGETDKAYEKRIKWAGRRAALATVAIGGAFLFAKSRGFYGVFDDDSSLQGTGAAGSGEFDPADTNRDGAVSDEERAAADKNKFDAADTNQDGKIDAKEQATANGFGYSKEDDPFFDQDKTNPHNFGVELVASDDDPAGAEGLGDLKERWQDSPEQTGQAYWEMILSGDQGKIDAIKTELGLPANADQFAIIEAFSEHAKANPDFLEAKYNELNGILENQTTTYETITLAPGTYGSYYEVDVDGNGVVAYDQVVNEPATVIKVRYQDANGVWQERLIKEECGGQFVHLKPVEKTVVPHVPVRPIGGGEQPPEPTPETTPPTPETTPPTPETNPPETEPPVTNPPETEPPTTNPPETEPPVTNPPETEPPVTPAPKNPEDDINQNPDLNEQVDNGDDEPTGPGELDEEPTEPEEEYTPPAEPEPTQTAPGAETNERDPSNTEGGNEVPAAETGANPEPSSDDDSGTPPANNGRV